MAGRVSWWVVLGGFVVGGGVLGFWQTSLSADDESGIRIEQGDEVHKQYEALVQAAERAAMPEGLREVDGAEPVAVVSPLEKPVAPPTNPDAIRFLLEDAEGEPVPGITAWLLLLPGELANRAYRPAMATEGWTSFLDPAGPVFEATSNENGELRFDGVPLMRRYRVDLPGQRGYAHTCYFGSSSGRRVMTIPMTSGGSPLILRVEGLPAHYAQACVIVRRGLGRDLWSPVIAGLRAQCVVPLSTKGQTVTPELPQGPLVADVVVPDVGIWRGCAVERQGDGMALVSLATESTMTLKGVLRGPDGKGVPEATLTLAVVPYLETRPSRAWLRTAKSNAEGRFEFAAVPVGVVKELFVTAEGFVAPRLLLENAPLLPHEVLDVPIQLMPSRSVVGVVTDSDGKPRPGVRIRPSSDTGMVIWDPGATWTDAKGRYRIDGLPPGKLTLAVSELSGPGRTKVKTNVKVDGITQAPRAVLVLRVQSGKITVQVVDMAGKPVSGAGIGYRVKHDNMTGTIHTGPTAADGIFQITGLATGYESIQVWAYKRGGATVAQAVSPPDVEAGTATLRIVLPPVGRIHGQVVQDGKPVPNIAVAVQGTRLTAMTDFEGRFRLRGVPIGDQRVHVRSGSGAVVGRPARVRVTPDERATAVLDLGKEEVGITVRGRLVDGKGRSLAGVVLNGDPRHRFPTMRGMLVQTAEDGRFALPVPGRGDYPLYSGERQLAGALSAGTDPVDVVFDPASIPFVQGRLLDETGRQAYALSVAVTREGSGRFAETHGAGGYFRMYFPKELQGKFQVEAQHGYRDRLGRKIPYRIDPVAFKPGDTVVLQRKDPEAGKPAETGLDLRGFVVDEDGEPVPRAVVTLDAPGARDGRRKCANTSADGTFVLLNVPEGTLHVHAAGPRPFVRMQRPIPVDPREGPVRITIPRIPASDLYTVCGRVLDLDDQPVPGVELWLTRPRDMDMPRVKSDEDGRFEFPYVRRGPARVEISPWWESREYAIDRLHVHVDVIPERNHVVVRVPAHRRDAGDAHAVEITLVDPEGSLIPNVHPSVLLHGLGHRKGMEHRSDPFAPGREAGRFRLEGISAGRYRIHVGFSGIDPPYLDVESFEIWVPRGTVLIPLERAVELHGQIEDKERADYWVYLWTRGGSRYLAKKVSASGAFVFHVGPDQVGTLTACHSERPLYGILQGVKAAGSPHRIVLQEGLEIAGELEGYEKLPRKYELRIEGPMYDSGEIPLDGEGRFRVQGLRPGTYVVRFTDDDIDLESYEPSIEVIVEAGDTQVVLRQKARK